MTTTAGTYPVTITASDQQDASTTQSFDVRIIDPAAPNSPPVMGGAVHGDIARRHAIYT
ncbi:hypothetical protein [Novipirellula maiorica]|uniref:hypothetical protein n=1 Tax=Novipirellula maiorica TaxID=1265734 RepID=UPI001360B060|nr:hypothetical protein [Rhodopirellula maiorica]